MPKIKHPPKAGRQAADPFQEAAMRPGRDDEKAAAKPEKPAGHRKPNKSQQMAWDKHDRKLKP